MDHHSSEQLRITGTAPNRVCRISLHVLWGLQRQNTVFALGRSIVDGSSSFDISAMMLAR